MKYSEGDTFGKVAFLFASNSGQRDHSHHQKFQQIEGKKCTRECVLCVLYTIVHYRYIID